MRTAVVHMRQSDTIAEGRNVCCVCFTKESAKTAGKKSNTKLARSGMSPLLWFGFIAILGLVLWLARPFLNKEPEKKPVVSTAAVASTPVKQVQMQAVLLNLRSDFLFEFGSAVLKPESAAELRTVAGQIRAAQGIQALIRGYTDSIGTAAENKALALKRAQSVRDWLIREGGLPAAQFAVEGMGAQDPVAPNTLPDGRDNPDGRQKNRRVTITITGGTVGR
jgi:outer membrane protein OmpA-like peptidoglycan-associated protein